MSALVWLASVLVGAQFAPSVPTLRIGMLGDTQNYVTTLDPGDDAVRAQLLDALASDVVAQHPDLVLQVGDLTDSTGGPDQLGLATISDDPNWVGQTADLEWQRIRNGLFDRLDAAGIPHFEVTGNHDSCVGFEQRFPASEFVKLPGHFVDSRPGKCGAGFTDTTNRAGLYQTPIGPVCVLGAPYASVDIDWPWLVSHIGCGQGAPTIYVNHSGNFSGFANVSAAQRALLIQESHGHFVCTGCSMSLQSPVGTRISTFTNWQETSFGGPGGTNHTGLSWWAILTIDPKANTSTLAARNPYLGVTEPASDAGYAVTNNTIPLPYSGCARFKC